MTSPQAQLEKLIAEIEATLGKASPRLPWVMAGDVGEQRRLLQEAKDCLQSLQSSAITPSPWGSVPPGSPGISEAELGGQQVLQALLQEMQYLRSQTIQPLRTEVSTLQQQRDQLLQEVRQLEQERLQLAAQPAAALPPAWMDEMMARLQVTVAQQVRQTLQAQGADGMALYGSGGLGEDALESNPDIPQLQPQQRLEQLRRIQAQTDYLLLKLDSSLRVVFESMEQSIQSYRDSLHQGLDTMHGLGQQGEVIFETLVNHLAQQLGQDRYLEGQSEGRAEGRGRGLHSPTARLTPGQDFRDAPYDLDPPQDRFRAEAAEDIDLEAEEAEWLRQRGDMEETLDLDALDLDGDDGDGPFFSADEDEALVELENLDNEALDDHEFGNFDDLDDMEEDVTVFQSSFPDDDEATILQTEPIPWAVAIGRAQGASGVPQPPESKPESDADAPDGAETHAELDALYESLFGHTGTGEEGEDEDDDRGATAEPGGDLSTSGPASPGSDALSLEMDGLEAADGADEESGSAAEGEPLAESEHPENLPEDLEGVAALEDWAVDNALMDAPPGVAAIAPTPLPFLDPDALPLEDTLDLGGMPFSLVPEEADAEETAAEAEITAAAETAATEPEIDEPAADLGSLDDWLLAGSDPSAPGQGEADSDPSEVSSGSPVLGSPEEGAAPPSPQTLATLFGEEGAADLQPTAATLPYSNTISSLTELLPRPGMSLGERALEEEEMVGIGNSDRFIAAPPDEDLLAVDSAEQSRWALDLDLPEAALEQLSADLLELENLGPEALSLEEPTRWSQETQPSPMAEAVAEDIPDPDHSLPPAASPEEATIETLTDWEMDDGEGEISLSDGTSGDNEDLSWQDTFSDLEREVLDLGEDDLDLGEDVLDLEEGALTSGDNALDLGEDVLDLSEDALDLGEDALDLGEDTSTPGENALDLDEDALDLGEDALTTADFLSEGEDSLPDDEDSLPDLETADLLSLGDDDLTIADSMAADMVEGMEAWLDTTELLDGGLNTLPLLEEEEEIPSDEDLLGDLSAVVDRLPDQGDENVGEDRDQEHRNVEEDRGESYVPTDSSPLGELDSSPDWPSEDQSLEQFSLDSAFGEETNAPDVENVPTLEMEESPEQEAPELPSRLPALSNLDTLGDMFGDLRPEDLGPLRNDGLDEDLSLSSEGLLGDLLAGIATPGEDEPPPSSGDFSLEEFGSTLESNEEEGEGSDGEGSDGEGGLDALTVEDSWAGADADLGLDLGTWGGDLGLDLPDSTEADPGFSLGDLDLNFNLSLDDDSESEPNFPDAPPAIAADELTDELTGGDAEGQPEGTEDLESRAEIEAVPPIDREEIDLFPVQVDDGGTLDSVDEALDRQGLDAWADLSSATVPPDPPASESEPPLTLSDLLGEENSPVESDLADLPDLPDLLDLPTGLDLSLGEFRDGGTPEALATPPPPLSMADLALEAGEMDLLATLEATPTAAPSTSETTAPPPPPPSPAPSAPEQWFLGLDLGATGLSAVLMNRADGKAYPLYWNLPNGTGSPDMLFRLPAVAALQPAPGNEPWSVVAMGVAALTISAPGATESGPETLVINGIKPFLATGIPHRDDHGNSHPLVQWSDHQGVPLRELLAAVQGLLTALTGSPTGAIAPLGAAGLPLPTLTTALGQLQGIVVGYSAQGSDTYRFNLREIILGTGLVTAASQICFMDDGIAALLSGLPDPHVPIPPGQTQTLYQCDWQGGTVVISAGATLTQLGLIDVPTELETLTHDQFALRTLAYGGDALDLDIISHLLAPPERRQPRDPDEFVTAPEGDWHWQATLPSGADPHWDSLGLGELVLPRLAESDADARIRLRQRLTASPLGQSLLEAAHHLKLILQNQAQFHLELGDQSWQVFRRDFESRILVPYIQRINQNLNMLLSQTGLASQGVRQVICTGGNGSFTMVAKWLRQKFPNATIIQDTYPTQRPASCSRVAYGLVNLCRYSQMLDRAQHQYSDYFLLQELLTAVPDQSLTLGEILSRLEQQGVNTEACQARIVALVEGHLPPGLGVDEAVRSHLSSATLDRAEYRALRSAALFTPESGQRYRLNPVQADRIRQHLAMLMVGKAQALTEPLMVPGVLV